MYRILFTCVLLATFGNVWSQDRLADPRVTYGNTITARELKVHLDILASDEFEGRETGEKGQKMAARYISGIYKRDLIDHPELPNGYFQSIDFVNVGWGNRWMIVGDSLYKFFEDFYGFLGTNKDTELNTNEILFLGYGIDDSIYSDYRGVDVQGKIIVVKDGEPKKDGMSLLTGTESNSAWSDDWSAKMKAAEKHGVAAVLIIDNKFDIRMGNERWREYIDHGTMDLKEEYSDDAALNYLFISQSMSEELLSKKKLQKAEKKMAKKGKSVHFSVEKKTQLKIAKVTEDVFSENVAGFVEGTDLKDEIIVVSAHYDHIGVIDGEVYNGADDDGSGTVALMEVAQAIQLAKNGGYGPRRSVLFLSFTGEEKGLLGSRYYASNPIFPMENTVANLNIDMVGRVDEDHVSDTNYVYVIGSDFLSTELHEINEYNAEHYTDLTLDYKFNSTDDPNRFYYRSDHYNFAKFGVPVIFFFNGTHEDYHQAGDEVEKIRYEILEKRTKLVFHDVWTLANMEKRIVVDVPQED